MATQGVGPSAEVWAIVLAAGSGERFGGYKQFARARSRSLVEWSCSIAAEVCDHVVLVLPPAASDLARPAGVSVVILGGLTRRLSVSAGLAAVPMTAPIVVVHDAAHPAADATLFVATVTALAHNDTAAAAVPVLPVNETLVRARPSGTGGEILERGYLIFQMPQAFRREALAWATTIPSAVADEASLLVTQGEQVVHVAGSAGNLHVTSAADLAVVEQLLTR
jgi:2-C-methyl-D-erythritol 4-phosphate cytidylyltransferase